MDLIRGLTVQPYYEDGKYIKQQYSPEDHPDDARHVLCRVLSFSCGDCKTFGASVGETSGHEDTSKTTYTIDEGCSRDVPVPGPDWRALAIQSCIYERNYNDENNDGENLER